MTPEELMQRAKGEIETGRRSTGYYETLNEQRLTPKALVEISAESITPVSVERELEGNQMAQTEETGMLMKMLDVILRSQYATIGAVQAMRHDQDISEAAWAGLKGETKGSWRDIMDEIAPGWSPLSRGIVGFAADVVLDPINLIPLGWIGKSAKLLGIPKALKAIDDITKTTKILGKAGEALARTAPVDLLGRMFKPGWGLRKVAPFIDPDTGEVTKIYDLYRYMQMDMNDVRRESIIEMSEKWDAFRKVAKKLGLNPDVETAKMIKMHQAGIGAEILGAFQKDFYKYGVRGFAKMAEEEIAHKILKAESVIENYFPGILERGKVVKEGERLYVGKHKGFKTKLGVRAAPFFTQPKELKTVEALKEWCFEASKKGVAADLAPVDNWFRGYAIRRMVGESAIVWKTFVDDVMEKFGKPLEQVLEESGVTLKEQIIRAGASGGKEATLEAIGKILDDPFMEGMIKAKLPIGMSFVTKTLNLRAPSMTKLLTQEIRTAMQKQATALDLGIDALMEVPGAEQLTKVFKKVRGIGVVELDTKGIKALTKAGLKDDIYLLPTEVAKEIKGTFKVFSSDVETKALFRGLDGLQHIWKAMATSMRVPFHMRNALSNTWQMYLAGVRPDKMVQLGGKAGYIQSQGYKGTGKNFRGFSPKELLQIADKVGVRAYGWLGKDVPTLWHKELRIVQERGVLARKLGFGENLLNIFQPLARTGRVAGTAIEDNARLTVFLDQMVKLGIKKLPRETYEKALARNLPQIKKGSKHVRKYLFDYTELTQFERNVMKRGFPFYTWLRKNIPLQLESVFTQPHKYARLAKFQNNLWPDTAKSPTEEQIMKYHWTAREGYRRSKWVTANGNPVYYKVDLPTEELSKMWRLETWMSALSPVKALYEILTNTRSWPEAGKLSESGQLVPAPFYMQWASEPLQKFAGMRPVLDAQGKTMLGMNPMWKHAIQNAFPFLSDWDRAYPSVGQVEEEEGLWKLVSQVGIKFRPLDLRKAQQQLFYGSKKAQTLIRRAARKQPKFTVQEAQKIYGETMKP